MRISVESTDEIAHVNGVPTRVWRGVTEAGIAVDLFTAIVRVRREADQAQFMAELREIEPRRMPGAIDMRYLID